MHENSVIMNRVNIQDIRPSRRSGDRPLHRPSLDVAAGQQRRTGLSQPTRSQTVSRASSISSSTPRFNELDLREKPQEKNEIDELGDRKNNPPNHKEVSFDAGKNRESAKFQRTRQILYIASILLLSGALGYFAIDAWTTNARIKEELDKPVIVDDADPESRQAAEGRDETEIPVDTLGEYKVAADVPRILSVEKLNIEARILPMSVNPDNSMQAPLNIYDSGWYTGSVKPGESGAMVIDGHASGPTREGLFAYIDTLREGDTLTIERGDGKLFTYTVRKVETIALENVDMSKLLKTYNGAEQGLNLITCAGEWLQEDKTFNKRTMVYATP